MSFDAIEFESALSAILTRNIWVLGFVVRIIVLQQIEGNII
ncbi:MAG: hypothetical protein Q4G06_11425 [Clostridia bacterium]|nr:hypothetical protein [Clostridia bacterium]